jgi:hypothetical protein
MVAMRGMSWLHGFGLVAALGGCGVPEPPGTTGGIGDAGLFRDGAAPGEACGRGFVVVEQADDFRSTNVALVGLDGQTLSASFASSTTGDVGLAPPLIGDIAAPTMSASGNRVVLLDRDPAAVLLWFDVVTGWQTARLDVGTGFASNPHDYLEVSPTKAYVTRFASNPDPGKEPHDAGGDVLIVDPSVPAITGSIRLAEAVTGVESGIFPRPGRLVRAGDRAYVLLGPTGPFDPVDASRTRTAAARVVAVDVAADAIVDVLVLEGLEWCTGLSLSPDATQLAVGCTTFAEDLSRAGIALVDLEPALSERARFRASDLGDRPLGFFVEFSGPGTVLTPSHAPPGASGGAADDRLLEIDLSTGEARTLVSRPDYYVLGEVRCATGCGVCVAADAGVPGGVLHVLDVEDGRVTASREHVVERLHAMPPRYVGRF